MGSCATSPWHFDGSTWADTGPVLGDCGTITAVSANEAWLTRGSTMLRWNGSTWAPSDSGKPDAGWGFTVYATPGSTWAGSASDVWIGPTQQISFLHFNGASWSSVPTPLGRKLGNSPISPHVALGGPAANDLWATTENQTLLHFTGSSWSEVPSGINAIRAIVGASANDAWLVGDYMTALGGGAVLNRRGHWHTSVAPPANSLNAASIHGQRLWAAGNVGHFDPSSDGGVWSMEKRGSDPYYGVYAAADDDVYFVGKNFAQHWNGLSWQTAFSGTAQTLRAIWGLNASEIWAVGDLGTVVRFTGGQGTKQTIGTSARLNGVWGRSANDVWLVGASGTIQHWVGAAFETVNAPLSSVELIGVSGTATTLYLLGATRLYQLTGTTVTEVARWRGGEVARWRGATSTLAASPPSPPSTASPSSALSAGWCSATPRSSQLQHVKPG